MVCGECMFRRHWSRVCCVSPPDLPMAYIGPRKRKKHWQIRPFEQPPRVLSVSWCIRTKDSKWLISLGRREALLN